MTPLINKAVSARQGISIVLSQDTNGVSGTVMLSRSNNLRQLFSGNIAEALQKAEESSAEHGFEGYYEISGEDDVTAIGMTELGVISEINRQLNALQPKVGFSWGFSPSWSPAELAAMPAAQAHLSRLMNFRSALLEKLSVAAERQGSNSNGGDRLPASFTRTGSFLAQVYVIMSFITYLFGHGLFLPHRPGRCRCHHLKLGLGYRHPDIGPDDQGHSWRAPRL